jgi:quinol monooxygenase YgiN
MDAVEAVLSEGVPAVHEEDGCELYALHRGEDRLVFVEKWRDGTALAAHRSGNNVRAVGEKLSGLVAGTPDVQVLDAVPLGDAGKGSL